MTLSEAMRTAAEHSCELSWDEELRLWTIRAISYDGDPVCVSEAELLAMSPTEFVARALPERP